MYSWIALCFRVGFCLLQLLANFQKKKKKKVIDSFNCLTNSVIPSDSYDWLTHSKGRYTVVEYCFVCFLVQGACFTIIFHVTSNFKCYSDAGTKTWKLVYIINMYHDNPKFDVNFMECHSSIYLILKKVEMRVWILNY